jgi:hypothetical protein
MSSYRKNCLLTFAGSLALVLCAPAIAQQSADIVQQSADIAQQSADLVSPDQAGSAPAPQKATAAQTPSGSSVASSKPTSLITNGTTTVWGIFGSRE